MSKETETVKVTLELPKQIAEYIKAEWSTDNLEETLTKGIVEDSLSQLEGEDDTETTKALMKKYGLLPIFKQYGILPEYYREDHNKMSETETEEFEGKEPVTLKLPEPVYHFYKAVAETHKKPIEAVLIEELIYDIDGILDTEPREVLVGAFGLEKFIGSYKSFNQGETE